MHTRPESFDKNLLEIQPILRKVAYSLYKTTYDSDDLLQEVNARAMRYAHLFEEGTNFKGWMIVMMYNLFKQKMMRQQRSRKIFDETVDIQNENSSFRVVDKDNPEQNVSWKQQWEKLVPCMDDPAWQYLWEYDGRGSEHDYYYLAKMFNVPVGTIKSRIFKFRAKISKELAG